MFGGIRRKVLLTALVLLAAAPALACTIGVAGGDATADGRPLLWKVRDNTAVPDNEVYYNTSLMIPFIAVVTASGAPESPAWMGVNERGFALVNANAGDLVTAEAERANGEFMRAVLGGCATVDEFLSLLAATNGLRDTHANFGVIDGLGEAWIIEASRDTFWTYDTRDSDAGFIVRTNFACGDTTGTGIDGLPGEERFVRSANLVNAWVEAGELDVAHLAGRHARDFSNWACEPFPVPCYECGEPDSLYGWFDTYFSISARGSVSGAVIQGVAPPPSGEPAWLSTMWVHLGQPACTVALPYWPVGPAPAVADGPGTAPLCDLACHIREHLVFRWPYQARLVDSFALDDGAGGGLWSLLLPAEALMMEVTEERLTRWRDQPPAAATMLAFEDSLATAAHTLLALDVTTSTPPQAMVSHLEVRPNPFNPTTTLMFALPVAGPVRLDIHDLAGRRVDQLVSGHRKAGRHAVNWRPRGLSSGVYLARLVTADGAWSRRVALVR